MSEQKKVSKVAQRDVRVLSKEAAARSVRARSAGNSAGLGLVKEVSTYASTGL